MLDGLDSWHKSRCQRHRYRHSNGKQTTSTKDGYRFKEKTEQSKREAKRRGENISDEEEDEKTKKMGRKVREAEQKRSDIWKKPKKVKTKVEHKTYEQIVAEAGQESVVPGIGHIIDAIVRT